MADDAFVETSGTKKSARSIKLPLTEEGVIDWDLATDKNKEAFIDAIKNDANGILQNIKEEAGQTSTSDDEPSGIANATVVAATNLVMATEALGVSMIGPKFVPVLKNLHPVVALKACSVTEKEMEPVMPAAKRIVERYIPSKYLGQEYQDLAIVGEHLLKLSTQKFKDCVKLAIEIENLKNTQSSAANGKGVTIEGNVKLN